MGDNVKRNFLHNKTHTMTLNIPDYFVEELLDILNAEIIKHKDVIRSLRQKNEEGDYDTFIEANHDYIKEIEFLTAQLENHV